MCGGERLNKDNEKKKREIENKYKKSENKKTENKNYHISINSSYNLLFFIFNNL